jgi:hypothetical protein
MGIWLRTTKEKSAGNGRCNDLQQGLGKKAKKSPKQATEIGNCRDRIFTLYVLPEISIGNTTTDRLLALPKILVLMHQLASAPVFCVYFPEPTTLSSTA